MSKGLVIVSKYEVTFDSDIYTDIYNYYWGDTKYMYWYQMVSEVTISVMQIASNIAASFSSRLYTSGHSPAMLLSIR